MNQVKTDPVDIKEQITYCVLNAISTESDPSDEKLREIISEVISENTSYKMNLDQKREMAQMVFNSLRRLDVIEPLMEDPTITEIMVNGPDNIFFERSGKLYKSDIRFKDSNKTMFYSYLVGVSCDKDSVVLQDGETTEYKWLDKEEFLAHVDSEDSMKAHNLRYEKYINTLR